MTVHAEIIPPSPAGASSATTPPDNLALYGYAGTPSQRYDGWTAPRQRVFLQALSEGTSVTHACRIVGLSIQSAYAFRRAARGASFAIGWQAALLLAREVLADDLMERARHGVTDTFTYRNGETAERHRHDNTLAFKMLTRMDRMADAAHNEATHAAARLVAAEFDQYLDMIERDGGPARAGLFLGTRLGAEGVAASNDDLAPVRALARADHWLRTHTDLAEPLATADLDPAKRGGWTGEQWARAEAAGLVALAPPPQIAPQAPQHPQYINGLDQADGEPVWWDEVECKWHTRFPPPADFYGDEEGEYGDEDYSRELSLEEEEAVETPRRAEIEALRGAQMLERDTWFGFAPPALPETAPEIAPETEPETEAATEPARRRRKP